MWTTLRRATMRGQCCPGLEPGGPRAGYSAKQAARRASPRLKALAVEGIEDAEWRSTQPRRLLEHRVEHRREVAGRAVDNPQHLGHRGFAGQRFVALGRPRVELPPKLGYGLSEINLRVVGHRFAYLYPLHAKISFLPSPCQQECATGRASPFSIGPPKSTPS